RCFSFSSTPRNRCGRQHPAIQPCCAGTAAGSWRSQATENTLFCPKLRALPWVEVCTRPRVTLTSGKSQANFILRSYFSYWACFLHHVCACTRVFPRLTLGFSL